MWTMECNNNNTARRPMDAALWKSNRLIRAGSARTTLARLCTDTRYRYARLENIIPIDRHAHRVHHSVSSFVP
jgi:hypothetical protein